VRGGLGADGSAVGYKTMTDGSSSWFVNRCAQRLYVLPFALWVLKMGWEVDPLRCLLSHGIREFHHHRQISSQPHRAQPVEWESSADTRAAGCGQRQHESDGQMSC